MKILKSTKFVSFRPKWKFIYLLVIVVVWFAIRVDEILVGWISTINHRKQKATKILMVAGDGRKNFVFLQVKRMMTLLWWFQISTMFNIGWCFLALYVGDIWVYDAFWFGWCKLWSYGVCSINWDVIDGCRKT